MAIAKHRLSEEETALSALDPDFIDCRDLRHAWVKDGGFFRSPDFRGLVNRRLVCRRCGTIAYDHWTMRGERKPRTYQHPDGYRIEGQGRMTGEALRRVLMANAPIADSEREADKAQARRARRQTRASSKGTATSRRGGRLKVVR